jgi:hypothetical protein
LELVRKRVAVGEDEIVLIFPLDFMTAINGLLNISIMELFSSLLLLAIIVLLI